MSASEGPRRYPERGHRRPARDHRSRAWPRGVPAPESADAPWARPRSSPRGYRRHRARAEWRGSDRRGIATTRAHQGPNAPDPQSPETGPASCCRSGERCRRHSSADAGEASAAGAPDPPLARTDCPEAHQPSIARGAWARSTAPCSQQPPRDRIKPQVRRGEPDSGVVTSFWPVIGGELAPRVHRYLPSTAQVGINRIDPVRGGVSSLRPDLQRCSLVEQVGVVFVSPCRLGPPRNRFRGELRYSKRSSGPRPREDGQPLGMQGKLAGDLGQVHPWSYRKATHNTPNAVYARYRYVF